MKTNNTDLTPAVKDIAVKLGYQPVQDAKTPTYKKYGVLYKPTNNKLKRFKRVDPIQQEITYFGKRYVTSKAAAKILNVSQIVKKLKKYPVATLDVDTLTYWGLDDVIKIKNRLMPKKDPYSILDRFNDIVFRLIQTDNGQKMTSLDGKIEIDVNLILCGKKSQNIEDRIPVGEKFKHFPRTKDTDFHFFIGNKGTIINISLNHLITPSLNGRGRLKIKINGKNKKLHRLVAEIWLPNQKNKPAAHHINRNVLDNRALNLVFVTDLQHAKCHHLLKKIDKAKDKSSRAAARKDYRAYIKQLRRDNSQA